MLVPYDLEIVMDTRILFSINVQELVVLILERDNVSSICLKWEGIQKWRNLSHYSDFIYQMELFSYAEKTFEAVTQYIYTICNAVWNTILNTMCSYRFNFVWQNISFLLLLIWIWYGVVWRSSTWFNWQGLKSDFLKWLHIVWGGKALAQGNLFSNFCIIYIRFLWLFAFKEK